MSRRRHKPGYITFHPDGKRALREEQVRPVARWTLLELILLADIYKHEVRGSLVWLADELGMSRNTLKEHLRELEALGWVRIERGTNQQWGHETVIALPRWDLFTGEVGQLVGQEGGQVVGQNLTRQTPREQQEHAPSYSSSSSTSRKGLIKAASRKSTRATEPWGSWTPREPWSDRHLAYLRLHLSTIDEGRLFRYAGELSRELWRQVELGRPPTREVCAVAVKDVLAADGRAREEVYAREKQQRGREMEAFARDAAPFVSEEV